MEVGLARGTSGGRGRGGRAMDAGKGRGRLAVGTGEGRGWLAAGTSDGRVGLAVALDPCRWAGGRPGRGGGVTARVEEGSRNGTCWCGCWWG